VPTRSLLKNIILNVAKGFVIGMLNPPPDQRAHADNGNNPAAEQTKRVADTFECYTRQDEAAQAKAGKHNRKIRRWTRFASLVALAYFLATVAILVATIRSIQEARRATHAAKNAADAATQQTQIAEETEIRSLRPYLNVIPGNSKWRNNADGTVFVSLSPEMKVVGQTPAGQVNPMWKLKVAEFPMTDNFVFDYILTSSTATAVIFPGEPAPIIKEEITIDKSDVDAINKGSKRIYAVGTVIYIDSFAYTGKGRSSNFCFYTDMHGVTDGWYACPIHNGADWNPGKPATMQIPMSQ
jgi:hypothetical protein